MFVQTFRKVWLPAVLALGLVSCGGGGDDDGGAVYEPGAYVQGIWRGEVLVDGTDMGLVVGMIAANGDANLILFGGDTQLRGIIWSDPTQIDASASFLSLFNFVGDLSGVYHLIDGTVVPASTIVANLKRSTDDSTLNLDLQFDPIYQRAGSLSTLAGTWRYESGGFTKQWQIDSSGALSGSDSNGCNYAGQVTVPDPAHNLYRMSYQITGCYSITVQVRGLAMLDDTTVANDTLYSAGTGDVGILDANSFVDRMTRQ